MPNSHIKIGGVAANYRTNDAKLVKSTLNCTDETSEVIQSVESLPFSEVF